MYGNFYTIKPRLIYEHILKAQRVNVLLVFENCLHSLLDAIGMTYFLHSLFIYLFIYCDLNPNWLVSPYAKCSFRKPKDVENLTFEHFVFIFVEPVESERQISKENTRGSTICEAWQKVSRLNTFNVLKIIIFLKSNENLWTAEKLIL